MRLSDNGNFIKVPIGREVPRKKRRGKACPFPVSESFTLAVADSSAAMFSVCAWVILFSALGSFTDLIPLGENFKIFIKSVLEVTTGVSAAAGKVPLPIICLIAGFGGISVHCQILKAVIKTEMKLSLFITSRIINGALAATLCEIILKVFPVTVSVLSNSAEAVPIAYSSSMPAAAGLLITGGLLILELDSKRRMC